jgi:hypothetical protein
MSDMDFVFSIDSDAIIIADIDERILGYRVATLSAWPYGHSADKYHYDRRLTRSNVWDGTMGARGPLIDCDPTLWREAGCPTESQPVADGVALGVQPARAAKLMCALCGVLSFLIR